MHAEMTESSIHYCSALWPAATQTILARPFEVVQLHPLARDRINHFSFGPAALSTVACTSRPPIWLSIGTWFSCYRSEGRCGRDTHRYCGSSTAALTAAPHRSCKLGHIEAVSEG